MNRKISEGSLFILNVYYTITLHFAQTLHKWKIYNFLAISCQWSPRSFGPKLRPSLYLLDSLLWEIIIIMIENPINTFETMFQNAAGVGSSTLANIFLTCTKYWVKSTKGADFGLFEQNWAMRERYVSIFIKIPMYASLKIWQLKSASAKNWHLETLLFLRPNSISQKTENLFKK